MAAIKIYLDEDVHPFIAHAVRLRGYEALTTVEAGQRTAGDTEQIEFAISKGMALLTYNSRDFPRIHSNFVRSGRPHRGIIVATQDDPRRNVRGLLKLFAERSADDLRDALVYLNNWIETP